MSRLAEGSVDLVVTSPPYNLGISYGKYSDRQDRRSYLGWCGEWAGQVRRVLRPDGSLFLNIGAAPSNPMLPHEIVMTLREFFVLQNTIHWIKSIAIDDHCSRRPAGDAHASRSEAGRGAPGEGEGSSLVWPFQADQFAAISKRLPRIRFSFHEVRSRRTESARAWRAVSGQEQHRALASYSGRRSALPREHVVRPLRNNSKSGERTAASGDVSSSTRRMVYQTAWSVARPIPCWILFSASETQPSRAQRCGVKKFIGFEIDERIWRKRSGELLVVAAVDLESEIHLPSIDSTAPATSSALTAFMQRKSIGHSRRKQGLHST